MATESIVYEYKSVSQGLTQSSFNRRLETLQEEGWEVTSVIPGRFLSSRTVELRRPTPCKETSVYEYRTTTKLITDEGFERKISKMKRKGWELCRVFTDGLNQRKAEFRRLRS